MNVFLLMHAIAALLREETAQLPLCTGEKSGNGLLTRAPGVWLGSLPSRNGAQPAYETPFIVVQAMNGWQDEDNFARAEIAVRVCVWHENREACENDLHNLLALCRRSLLRQRAKALCGRYILTVNDASQFLPWVRPDEQGLQYLEAWFLSHWKMQGIE